MRTALKPRTASLITYISAEPFLTHFGIGGMLGAKPMVNAFFRFRGLSAVTNAVIREAQLGKVVLEDGREFPFTFAIIIPPFLGADVIRNSPGIGNDKGFVEVDDCYRHRTYRNIWPLVWPPSYPAPAPPRFRWAVPKTGYMSEVMARYAAKNIVADIKKSAPKPKPFESIKPLCIMDAGDMEVLIVGTNMFPPRRFSALVPNPFGDWAKVLFEKFYLWRMRTGRTNLP